MKATTLFIKTTLLPIGIGAVALAKVCQMEIGSP